MFEHRGYAIDVNQHGRFVAVVGELEVSEQSLKECQASIDRAIGGLEKPEISLVVFGVLYKQRGDDMVRCNCFPARVIGFNRTTRNPQFSGLGKGEDLQNIVPDTPANRVIVENWRTALNAEELAKRQLDKIRIDWNLGYGRLGIDEYAGKLETAKQQYRKAVEASK